MFCSLDESIEPAEMLGGWFLPLDLSSFSSIKKSAEKFKRYATEDCLRDLGTDSMIIYSLETRLHVLFNNA